MDYVNDYENGSEERKAEILKELAAFAATFKTLSERFKSEHDVGDYNGIKISSKTLTDYSSLVDICVERKLNECLEIKVKATEIKKAVKEGKIAKEELALCATVQTKVLSVK